MMHLPQQLPATVDGHGTQRVLIAQPDRQAQPLGTLSALPGTAFTTVDPADGGTGVVLRPVTDDRIVGVCIGGEPRPLSTDVAVLAVTDLATIAVLRQQALVWVAGAVDVAGTEIRELAARAAQLRRDHAAQLAAIRAYAIDGHRDDEICRDGLDRFLKRFDLEPYDPRHTVRFTVSGTVTVIPEGGRDADDTAEDVRGWLRLDTSHVDGADEDSVTCTVSVDTVEVRDA